jgi:hypothetical protein
MTINGNRLVHFGKIADISIGLSARQKPARLQTRAVNVSPRNSEFGILVDNRQLAVVKWFLNQTTLRGAA